jgi:hypothetical protein
LAIQIAGAQTEIEQRLERLDLPFVVPDVQLFAVLYPLRGEPEQMEDEDDPASLSHNTDPSIDRATNRRWET